MFTVVLRPPLLPLPMSGPAKGMLPISADIPAGKREYIDSRIAPLGWSRAQAVAKIVDFWIALGCPPLSDLEAKGRIESIDSDSRVVPLSCWLPYLPRPTKASASSRS